MKDMYKTRWLREFMDEYDTLQWPPYLILADMIYQLIVEIQALKKRLE
jgi:hypothetical protein